MSTALQKTVDEDALRRLVIFGDLSKLDAKQQDEYYVALCDALRIDWRMRPFDYLRLNNKLVLYANKNCGEQLRGVHKISITITDKIQDGEIYIVTARAEMNGRVDESTGAVTTGGLKGEARANAIMKAETKAKRRVTLSIVGAGMLDETETETIPNAQKVEPKDITPKTDTETAQEKFEREKGITPEPQPEPVEETPEEKAKREKLEIGKQRAARVMKQPKDVQEYFLAAKLTPKRMMEVLDANEDDPERVRSWMADNPISAAPEMPKQGEEGMPV